jgi:hypothetical protein
MIFGARFDAGLGDAALFLRFSRLGQFWDWVAGEVVNSESPDTGLLVVEYPNSGDSVQSWYGTDITVPAGGPWTVELVEASTGATVATDNTGLEAYTYRGVLALLGGDRQGGKAGAGNRTIERVDKPGTMAVILPVADQHGNTSGSGVVDLEE